MHAYNIHSQIKGSGRKCISESSDMKLHQQSSFWSVESHSDVIVCKPSHHLTATLTRKINARLHSTVVVACFDCSPLPLCVITHNYLSWLLRVKFSACKLDRHGPIFPNKITASTRFTTRRELVLSTSGGMIVFDLHLVGSSFCDKTVFIYHADTSAGSQRKFRV